MRSSSVGGGKEEGGGTVSPVRRTDSRFAAAGLSSDLSQFVRSFFVAGAWLFRINTRKQRCVFLRRSSARMRYVCHRWFGLYRNRLSCCSFVWLSVVGVAGFCAPSTKLTEEPPPTGHSVGFLRCGGTFASVRVLSVSVFGRWELDGMDIVVSLFLAWTLGFSFAPPRRRYVVVCTRFLFSLFRFER